MFNIYKIYKKIFFILFLIFFLQPTLASDDSFAMLFLHMAKDPSLNEKLFTITYQDQSGLIQTALPLTIIYLKLESGSGVISPTLDNEKICDIELTFKNAPNYLIQERSSQYVCTVNQSHPVFFKQNSKYVMILTLKKRS